MLYMKNALSQQLLLFVILCFFSFSITAQSATKHTVFVDAGYWVSSLDLFFDHQYELTSSGTHRSRGIYPVDIHAPSVGLGYVYSLGSRWQLQVAARFSEGKSDLLEEDNRRLFADGEGIDVTSLQSSIEHRYSWGQFQAYWRALRWKNVDVAIGAGASWMTRRHFYRSGFVYSDINGGFTETQYTKDILSNWGGVLSARIAAPLGNRLWLGLEGGAQAHIGGEQQYRMSLQLGYLL